MRILFIFSMPSLALPTIPSMVFVNRCFGVCIGCELIHKSHPIFGNEFYLLYTILNLCLFMVQTPSSSQKIKMGGLTPAFHWVMFGLIE